jgi:23S rRNA (cytosine1962-C5)-methyltransferase
MAIATTTSLPRCVLFEDEHLLVVLKPAGWNTHAPSPWAGEGIYEWLKHREPRWASLAIIHRLDKETSGILVFGKTPQANRSLTEQFTARTVLKKYVLLSHRKPERRALIVTSNILRAGERYRSGTGGESAETEFVLRTTALAMDAYEVEATPRTGRTHQIRVHAAENGFAILGDTIYGGKPWPRVCLHAEVISFTHPATGQVVCFKSPADFSENPRLRLREAILGRQETADSEATNAFRLIHGTSDGWPGWYVERLGDFLLSQCERELGVEQLDLLRGLQSVFTAGPGRAMYHKTLSRHVRGTNAKSVSPKLVLGGPAPERFVIRENGVNYELSFAEGYSVGLFVDQRDNRRRLLTGHVAADFEIAPPAAAGSATLEILNCFAYTCAFSVCAALAGARVTSLDLSRKYLEWGRRNFALNGLDAAGHDFIFGDTFDWLRRFTKKQRRFEAVILDPPTFSQSKESGVFRVEKDFGRLVMSAIAVLKPGGVLLCSSNAAEWLPEDFVQTIEVAVVDSQRKIVRRHFAPQPPDHPVSRDEPAYLKTLWLQLD